MSKKTSKPLPPKLQAWVKARKRHRLSHAHVQMARELGMNPNKLGSLDNHKQEPWKAPLPDFIEHIYLKRFGRERPEVVVPIEQRARQAAEKKQGSIGSPTSPVASKPCARAQASVSRSRRRASSVSRSMSVVT
jgi:hypothetical protein